MKSQLSSFNLSSAQDPIHQAIETCSLLVEYIQHPNAILVAQVAPDPNTLNCPADICQWSAQLMRDQRYEFGPHSIKLL